MHTRDYVKSVLAAEGLYKSRNAKMEEFLKSIDDTPTECWPEFIARFRDKYYDLFDKVVPPLMFGNDRLVRTILARAIDPSRKKEMELARQFVAKAETEQNEKELLALVAKRNTQINKDILEKTSLPKSILSQIALDEKLAAVTGKQTPKDNAGTATKQDSAAASSVSKETTPQSTGRKKSASSSKNRKKN